MPIEVKFLDSELRERYAGSERTTVTGDEKFFLHGDTTMEIEMSGDEATITLDSGFTLRVTAPEGGNGIHALQMQDVLKKGSGAQVKFGNQIVAELQFT